MKKEVSAISGVLIKCWVYVAQL